MRTLVDDFHKYYETLRIWEKNYWLGIPVWKIPFDMCVIQELIYRIKPEYIIETGTGLGGSAGFFASICELIGYGTVITIDIHSKYDFSTLPQKVRDRIIIEPGGSTNPILFENIEKRTKGKNNIVMLDSWHVKEYVIEEMKLYSTLVPVGSYMIVEDTHSGKIGHPVEWKYDNYGAYEAVEEFLQNNDEWEIDYECEKHIFTFNPKGWLRRIK